MGRASTRRVLLIGAIALFSWHAQATEVLGRAVRRNGSNPAGPCRASLRAELDRRGAPDTDPENQPDGRTTFSVPVNPSGHFQFTNIPPGRYLLVVDCPSASGVRELGVQADTETRIDPPLLLGDLTLEVVIFPAVDPSGQPWRLTVDATMPRLRKIAHNVTTSADGRWARRGLIAGNYRVNISSSDNKAWLQRFFNLSAKSGPLRVQLPFIRLSGQVRLNTEPVRAQLVFHNEAGGEPTTLTSDENGTFQGVVPVTAGAQETIWTVEAHAKNPPIMRRVVGAGVPTLGETSAWLDLALPSFAVHGIVVSQAGKPQNNTQVTFEEISNGARTSTATDETGGFEVKDLSPGKYIAVAESVEGVSERTPFQVQEGKESEVKLVLTPSDRVSFHVMSSHGLVADAAVQVWIAPGVPRWFTHTDQDGRFELKLPPGTTEVGLTIAAQGYAIKLTRLQISRDNDKSSSEANTVTLDSSGGTLVLDLSPPGHLADSSMTPYLVHNKTVEAVGTLVGSSTKQADVNGAEPLAFQIIEPGIYSLCLVGNPAELAAFWFGAPPSSHCRTGSVEQGKTLTLSAP
jgi:carboxypeptidase family protein